MLPQTFRGGATVGAATGGGTLMVGPRSLVLEPGPMTRRHSGIDRLAHDRSAVTVITSRLLPPHMNTRLLIEAGEAVAIAALPGWFRPRLRRALHEAGFEVREQRRWLSMGLEHARPWE